MSPLTSLSLACGSFVGTHLLMSHPLRAPLVRMLGPKGFQALYILISLGTFGWIIGAWRALPAMAPAWVAGDGLWMVATILMGFASILLAGSFIGNPAMPSSGALSMAMRNPVGVFAITRHPMMWSIALWAIIHLLIWPTIANGIVCFSILILALVGAAGQDGKKAQAMGDAWRGWCRRTAFFPFTGQISGRIGWATAWPGWGALLGGGAIWLLATWTHVPLGASMAAGIWRWWG